MKRKLFPIWITLSCLAIVGLTVCLQLPHEPVYLDRTLTQWLPQFDSRLSPQQRNEAAMAIRTMGTNALPGLLKIMREDGSTFTRTLDQLARMQTYFEVPMRTVERWRAINAFRALGPVAEPAIPALGELLVQEATSCTAMMALVAIGPNAVPCLKSALTNPNEFVRSNAVWGLTRLHMDV